MILRDMAQDFMSTIASMGFIRKYTHEEDRNLNWIFVLVGAICICFYENNILLENRLLSGKNYTVTRNFHLHTKESRIS